MKMKKLEHIVVRREEESHVLKHDIYLKTYDGMILYTRAGAEFKTPAPILRNLREGRLYATDKDWEEYYGGDEK